MTGMDYDRQYQVATDNGGGTQSRGHTLFEACLSARTYGSTGIVVSPEGRLVAFFCGHRNRIAPGFGAYPYEREQIVQDFGFEPLP